MPIIKSAVKRMKQTLKRRNKNTGIKKDIKSATKALTVRPSSAALSKAQSELDKAVKKGLIKKNTAARRKSNLAKQAKAAGVKLAPAAKKATATKAAAPKAAAKPAAKAALKAAVAKKATVKKPAAKKATK